MAHSEERGTKGGQTTVRERAARSAPEASTPTVVSVPSTAGASEAAISDLLWTELCNVFDNPDEWLDTVNFTFGGATPRAVIAAGRGDQVLDRLYAIQAGIFS